MCLGIPKQKAAPVAATPVQEQVAPTPTAVETTDLGKDNAQEEAIKKENKKRGYASTIKAQDQPTLMSMGGQASTGNTTLG